VLSAGASVEDALFVASADGSRMVIAQAATHPTYFYTSADDRLSQPPLANPLSQGVNLSRDGRIVVSGGDVRWSAWPGALCWGT
jgi:hypothetical protein